MHRPYDAIVTLLSLALSLTTPLLGKNMDQYKTQIPLSKQLPKAVAALPCFGRIEWTVERLPFVAEGPRAGISGSGMAVHRGRIYMCGGFIPAGDETQDRASRRTSRWAHCYDPASRKWTRLPDMPGRREYTRAIATEEAVYVVGGGCQFKGDDVPYRPFGDCFRLIPSAQPLAWEAHSRMSVPRTHMAVGYVDGRLIVAGGNEYDFARGGYGHGTVRGLTEVLDLGQPASGWQRAAPLPGPPRGWAASSVCRGRLYVLGGLTFAEDNRAKSLACAVSFDPAANQWAEHTAPPIAISGWEGATHKGRYIVALGGVAAHAGKTIWNDLAFAYDTQDDRWLRIDGPLPPGAIFNDSGVCIIGDTIYVDGGEGPFGTHFNYFLIGRIVPMKP